VGCGMCSALPCAFMLWQVELPGLQKPQVTICGKASPPADAAARHGETTLSLSLCTPTLGRNLRRPVCGFSNLSALLCTQHQFQHLCTEAGALLGGNGTPAVDATEPLLR